MENGISKIDYNGRQQHYTGNGAIGSSCKKILFILEDGRLKATLTDGDVRRWILSGGDLSESISKVANYRPFYLKKKINIELMSL